MGGPPNRAWPPVNVGYACLNPAIGVGTALVQLFKGNLYGIEWFWIYLAFPVVGALLGVFFHEIIYKRL